MFFFFDGPLHLALVDNVWDLALHLRRYQLKKNFNKFPSNIKSFLISRYSSCRNKTFVSNVTYKIPGVLEFYIPDELTSPMI